MGANTLVNFDPRDKVYSLLGLSGDPVAPDYGKPTEEVFAQFADIAWISVGDASVLQWSGIGVLPVHTGVLVEEDFKVHHLFLPS
jgi:hypothetical protein